MGMLDYVNATFDPKSTRDFPRISNYENEELYIHFNYTQAPEPRHLYINQPFNPSRDYALAGVEEPTKRYYTDYNGPWYGTNTMIVSIPEQPVDGGTWGNLVSGQGQSLGGLNTGRQPAVPNTPTVNRKFNAGTGVPGISPGTGLGDSYSLQNRMIWQGTAIKGEAPTSGVYTGVSDEGCT